MAADGTLRVVTYNIWGRNAPGRYWRERSVVRGAVAGSRALHCADPDRTWRARRPMLVRALTDADADLVALQEVARGDDPAAATAGPGRQERSQADELAERLPGGPVRAVLSGAVGGGRLALLTRLPVLGGTEHRLPIPRGMYGGHPTVLEVVLAEVTVWVLHLPVGPDAAKPALAAALRRAATAAPADRPLLVCGDLNWPADGAPMRELLAAGALADPWPAAGGSVDARTMPLPDRRWRLDHVLHRPADRIRVEPGARLLGEEPDAAGFYPSDHCGLLVAFRLR